VKSLEEGDREVRKKDGEIRMEGSRGEKGQLHRRCTQSARQKVNLISKNPDTNYPKHLIISHN
jgi:hypothetical protein